QFYLLMMTIVISFLFIFVVYLISCFSFFFFFFSSRRRHTRCLSDWSSDVCSSDLVQPPSAARAGRGGGRRGGSAGDRGADPGWRSEERRVGKECRSRWAAEQ